MLKKKYSAQALAIAMVVLVVSSILAVSIYSRISKDKTLSLDERASAEALEVSDLILDYLTDASINDVITDAEEASDTQTIETGISLTQDSDNTQISNLLEAIGINAGLDSLDICPLSVAGNSYILSLTEGDLDTYFEIRPGQMMALPLKGMALGDDCSTVLRAAVRGDSTAGFTITKVYAKDYVNGLATSYKPYDESDVVHYCFSSGTGCNNSNFLDSSSDGVNWVYFPDDNTGQVDLNLKTTSGTYQLDEIKITAIGGTVGIAYQINNPESCTQDLKMINVQAAANCSGSYRGKSVLIPKKQWESPIFNYTIFNGEGSL